MFTDLKHLWLTINHDPDFFFKVVEHPHVVVAGEEIDGQTIIA